MFREPVVQGHVDGDSDCKGANQVEHAAEQQECGTALRQMKCRDDGQVESCESGSEEQQEEHRVLYERVDRLHRAHATFGGLLKKRTHDEVGKREQQARHQSASNGPQDNEGEELVARWIHDFACRTVVGRQMQR